MFDANQFKKSVKEWIRENPDGDFADFQDYCEEQIPTAQFASYRWLVEQTLDWYKHILAHREVTRDDYASDEDSDEASMA